MKISEEYEKEISDMAREMMIRTMANSSDLVGEIDAPMKDQIKMAYRNLFLLAELFYEVVEEKKHAI